MSSLRLCRDWHVPGHAERVANMLQGIAANQWEPAEILEMIRDTLQHE
jgi:hypothetical protein